MLVSNYYPSTTQEGYFFWDLKFIPTRDTIQGPDRLVYDFYVAEVELTAYTSEPNQTDDSPFITANGTRVYDGGIACPGRSWFGRMVEFSGKRYQCNDVMNIRYRNKMYFDIWMEDKAEAIQFGRVRAIVKIEVK